MAVTGKAQSRGITPRTLRRIDDVRRSSSPVYRATPASPQKAL